MQRALAGLLRQSAVVLFHSGEAAAHFASECDRLGIARNGITIAALAPRVAEAAGQGWAALATAETATDAALLALTCQLCQSSGEKRG
jgi:uroporphyrinogen-III synthase